MREEISFDSVAFSSLPEVIRNIGKRHLATKSKRGYDCYKNCFSVLDMFKSCYPQSRESLGEKSSRLFLLVKRLIGTQCLQGKKNVRMMGAQTSCQGDAGKVSFEFSSLLWRFPSLGRVNLFNEELQKEC